LLMARRGERHPTEIVSLFGKRLLVCQETGQGRRLNEPLGKWVTGGDKIQARRVREDFLEVFPTPQAVLVTNPKPTVTGTDNGIWRRIRLIPFTARFPDGDLRTDPHLPEKLASEVEGILAWCVRGCLEWQQIGLKAPQRVLAATEEYRADEDVVGQ